MANTGLPLNVPYPEPTDLVRDGAAAIQAVAEVINAPNGAYRYAGTRYFTSSGNFLKADPLLDGDIGLRAVRVRVQGGGGGGGGCSTTSTGGGGGGGGYAERFILASDLSASESVVRGAGGDGGAAGANNGQAGGTSSFASGQAYQVIGNGPATTTGVGRLGSVGGSGTGDFVAKGTDGGAAGSSSIAAGMGGSSHLGGGGRGGPSYESRAGLDGGLYGGGGGGGSSAGSTAAAGGNGADGIVIIDCFV